MKKIKKLLEKEIYENLSSWQKYNYQDTLKKTLYLDYINALSDNNFIELHGDRGVKDDKAMVGGWGINR